MSDIKDGFSCWKCGTIKNENSKYYRVKIITEKGQ